MSFKNIIYETFKRFKNKTFLGKVTQLECEGK